MQELPQESDEMPRAEWLSTSCLLQGTYCQSFSPSPASRGGSGSSGHDCLLDSLLVFRPEEELDTQMVSSP